MSAEQIVTPWIATCKRAFNYERLVTEFGLQLIDQALIRRIEAVTKRECHPWIKRGLVFSHQDLNRVLDFYEQGKPIYIYTGRGPSQDMHLGHLVPFMLTKWLQDAFHAIVVIQLSDEEKFYFKDNLTITDTQKFLQENAKDIVACGFDPNRTFIFSHYAYGSEMHPLAVQFMKRININQLKNVYGFTDDQNLGCFYWPIQQMCPAFPDAFPHLFQTDLKETLCLVPMAVDQFVYFRQARHLAEHVGRQKPAVICSKFLIGLLGQGDKMSSTAAKKHDTIYLNDTKAQVKEKVLKYAFSGGGATMKEHREKGADLSVDVSYQYLVFFEQDDAKMDYITTAYGSGRLSTMQVKNMMIDKVWEVLEAHQKARASITQDHVLNFFTKQPIRPL